MHPQLEFLLDELEAPAAPTAVHGRADAEKVHIADSLAGLELPEMREARRIADLGSGAGLPGLVLAIALPGVEVVCVESVGKKCRWIEGVVARLGLGNVRVVCSRAEEWREGLGTCDVVTARALAGLPVLVEYAAPLLREGGVLVAWKGAVDEEEERDGLGAAEVLGMRREEVRAVVPYEGSERRTLQVFRKIAPTPAAYPRRPGMAVKRPLTAPIRRSAR